MALVRKLKNASGQTKIWNGQTFAPEEVITIDDLHLSSWLTDAGVKSAIQAGDLVVDNGVRELSTSEGEIYFYSSIVPTGQVYLDGTSSQASSSDVGDPGQIKWDANYFYVCVGQNSWKRIPLEAF